MKLDIGEDIALENIIKKITEDPDKIKNIKTDLLEFFGEKTKDLEEKQNCNSYDEGRDEGYDEGYDEGIYDGRKKGEREFKDEVLDAFKNESCDVLSKAKVLNIINDIEIYA